MSYLEYFIPDSETDSEYNLILNLTQEYIGGGGNMSDTALN